MLARKNMRASTRVHDFLGHAAELLRHRLLAVADAEDRHARRIDGGRSGASRSSTEAGPPERITPFGRIDGGRSGASPSSTEAGPPESITPLGRIALKASSALWNGTISPSTNGANIESFTWRCPRRTTSNRVGCVELAPHRVAGRRLLIAIATPTIDDKAATDLPSHECRFV